jgi:hypothetical protein
MTAKKGTTKGKKKSSLVLTTNVVKIKFLCGAFCQARPKHATAHNGDIVTFIAVNTDVTLDFSPSPFQSGHTHLAVSQGSYVTEVINATPDEEYFYSLNCKGCPSKVDDPSVIIEP